MRKFHKISLNELQKYKDLFTADDIILPKRQTINSCGYDFYVPYDVEVGPLEMVKVYTGVKLELQSDEFLMLCARSSAAVEKGLILTNQVGIIDSDYFSNPGNDGHIIISIRHILNDTVVLKKGERIAQGVIMKYYKTYDDDNNGVVRVGGTGSTDKK